MTILIVEDADLMRLRLREILVTELNVENDNIFEAKHAQEALTSYKKINPDYVFLDIYMPGMNGVDAVEEILKVDPTAYIIMFTSSSERRTVISCIRNGARDYIKKPPTLEKVARSLSIDLRNPKPMKRTERTVPLIHAKTLEAKDKAPNRDIIEEIMNDPAFDHPSEEE